MELILLGDAIASHEMDMVSKNSPQAPVCLKIPLEVRDALSSSRGALSSSRMDEGGE